MDVEEGIILHLKIYSKSNWDSGEIIVDWKTSLQEEDILISNWLLSETGPKQSSLYLGTYCQYCCQYCIEEGQQKEKWHIPLPHIIWDSDPDNTHPSRYISLRQDISYIFNQLIAEVFTC